MSNKITLKEFFESKEKLAIHCNTEYKANRLLKEFDKLGKVWRDGDKYIENNYYGKNNNTCYYNDYTYGDLQSVSNIYKIYDFDDIIFEEQPKNLIPLIARELGVEIGERFFIGSPEIYFYFNENDLKGETLDGEELPYEYDDVFLQLLRGKSIIQKRPQKPKLTEAERVILENLPKEYKYIGRLENYGLVLYTIKPIKTETGVFDNGYANFGLYGKLFQFIKWEDEEPYNIEDLLKERGV